jgi:3-methyladenine DNA glycosylase AlkD
MMGMTARDVDARLKSLADPVFAHGQQNYFQHEVNTYGVRSPHLHLVAREVYAVVKKWTPAERFRFMEELWKLGCLESGGVVCHVCRRFGAQFGVDEFKLFSRWIDRYVDNWATTDGLSAWLLAACIGNQPALIGELPAWTTAKNRWRRRASAVSLLHEGKAGRHLKQVFDIADRLLDDRDDMVEKGVGWLLKETYPHNRAETMRFLLPRRGRASRTTLRYAAEKMTPADRAAVLARD